MYGEIGAKLRATSPLQLVTPITPPYPTGIGAYAFMHFANAVSTAKVLDVNGLMGAMPWIVPNAIVLTQVGIDVTSVTSVDAGAVYRFGIYADNGNMGPGWLIRDLGTVAADALSVTNPSFTAAFNLPLQAGLYWFSFAVQGAATARPQIGCITVATSQFNGGWSTTSGGYAIPLIGGISRSWRTWTPSTSPAFTTTTTGLVVANPWGGGLSTSSNAYPHVFIKIV